MLSSRTESAGSESKSQGTKNSQKTTTTSNNSTSSGNTWNVPIPRKESETYARSSQQTSTGKVTTSTTVDHSAGVSGRTTEYVSTAPGPPPSLTEHNAALSEDAAVSASLQCAENHYFNFYYNSFLQSGITVQVAFQQAKEAVSKLHEMGYFINLKQSYMQAYRLEVARKVAANIQARPAVVNKDTVEKSANINSSGNQPSITATGQTAQVPVNTRSNSSSATTTAPFQIKFHSQSINSGQQRLASAAAAAAPIQQSSPPQQPTAAIQSWIIKVYAAHSRPDPTWIRQLNQYLQFIVQGISSGKYSEKDWANEPVPNVPTILAVLASYQSELTVGPHRVASAPTVSETNSSHPESTKEDTFHIDYAARSKLEGADVKSLRKKAGRKQKSNKIPSPTVEKVASKKVLQNPLTQRLGLHQAKTASNSTSKSADSFETSLDLTPAELDRRQRRLARFDNNQASSDIMVVEAPTAEPFENMELDEAPVATKKPPPLTWQEKLRLNKNTEPVVGRSTDIEKPFLRLCGPPDPNAVRPEPILKKSFIFIKDKWNRERNWRYCEEQFRSLRQDLTVQGIKNSFALLLYETNARIALENNDLGQFNQCQAQIPELWKIVGIPPTSEQRIEFSVYRLLYLGLQNMRLDLLRYIGELSAAEKADERIQYAMTMRRAMAYGDYHRFFKLTPKGPFLSKNLLKIFYDRTRISALLTMACASRQVPVTTIKFQLDFNTLAETVQFLRTHECVLSPGDTHLDAKSSLAALASSPLLKSRKTKALG